MHWINLRHLFYGGVVELDTLQELVRGILRAYPARSATIQAVRQGPGVRVPVCKAPKADVETPRNTGEFCLRRPSLTARLRFRHDRCIRSFGHEL